MQPAEEIGPSREANRIAGMFDAIAPRYDFLNRLLSAGFDRRWRARAIRSLRLTGQETLLDICTGTADVALAARRAPHRARRVIGIDFAAAMLELGRRKIHAAREDDSIALLRGDAMQLPIRNGAVSALTVAFGIRNVEDATAACREMHRVLARGGRLAILEFAIPTMPIVRQAYLSYFTRALPMLGRLISRHTTAYSYLPASVTAFPSPDRFAQLLCNVGFTDVSVNRLTLGIVYLYIAMKGPGLRPLEGAPSESKRESRATNPRSRL
jgi:demethylmenaquinone methyltransferase/2-methoxy-6-polyprenyl-1,4-benzoquinol methylase